VFQQKVKTLYLHSTVIDSCSYLQS